VFGPFLFGVSASACLRFSWATLYCQRCFHQHRRFLAASCSTSVSTTASSSSFACLLALLHQSFRRRTLLQHLGTVLLLSSAKPGLALTWTSSLYSRFGFYFCRGSSPHRCLLEVCFRFGDRCYHVGFVASLERCFWVTLLSFRGLFCGCLWACLLCFAGRTPSILEVPFLCGLQRECVELWTSSVPRSSLTTVRS